MDDDSFSRLAGWQKVAAVVLAGAVLVLLIGLAILIFALLVRLVATVWPWS